MVEGKVTVEKSIWALFVFLTPHYLMFRSNSGGEETLLRTGQERPAFRCLCGTVVLVR
jgi:hypothetical protein